MIGLDTKINSLKIKRQNLKMSTLFHTRSNLLCLVCGHVVSLFFCSVMYFSLCKNMMCGVRVV